MVVSCCANGCRQRFIKGSSVTFHGFPKDPVRYKLWVAALGRDNFTPNKSTKLCSKHFTDDSFNEEKFGGHWLKDTAVPTLFNFSPHLKKNQKQRKSPKERTTSPENAKKDARISRNMAKSENMIEAEPTGNGFTPETIAEREMASRHAGDLKRGVEAALIKNEMINEKRRSLRYVGDFKGYELTPQEMEAGFDIAQKQVEKQKKIIRNLRQKILRFQNKQASMKIILKGLRRKGLISSLEIFKKASSSTEVDEPGISSVILPTCGPSADDAQQAFPNSPIEAHILTDENNSAIPIAVSANIVSSGVGLRNMHENFDQSISSTKDGSRKRPTSYLDEVRDPMDYAFSYLKSLTEKPKPDQVSLYMELFENKLRALNESNREIAMLEINSLLFRLKRQRENPLAFSHSHSFDRNSFTSNRVAVVGMMSSSSSKQPMPNIFVQPTLVTHLVPPRISVSSASSSQCEISNMPSVEMTFEAEMPLEQEESILRIKQEPLVRIKQEE